MIPKTIHYCWFGGNPLPKSAEDCIRSWEKHCPDYEIIEWNETNFDIDSNLYTKQAYENKKCFYADFNSVYLGHGICGSEYGNGLSGTDNI